MSFCKIDIDVFDEDVLQETELYEPDPRDPTRAPAEARQKQTNVRSAASHFGYVISGALSTALDSLPYGPNVLDEAKNLILQTVVSVLNNTKGTVPNILKSLSQDAQDTLMKYIYKGMGVPGWGDVSGSVILAWHGTRRYLTEVAGTGCIVRVMSDRRTT
ncbi:hypothetical protein PISMIDRAFT_116484 [Pisolithus microcarpus 441]|uniref:Actin-related protein 2/3 complex subunit 5 n=1 Tax=Pisolithus microcarpus 441 TaxID=765257 RepID=A0A0C9XR38_9AGAM|nr:hypothetical protein PISMIDRAFT_116484 [Pisolithus microcarpus 441]